MSTNRNNDTEKALREALLQAAHDLGCLAAALQLAAPSDPMVPFGYRMMNAARDALAANVRAAAESERTHDGKINNCAEANGYPASECQMCAGNCPDAAGKRT